MCSEQMQKKKKKNYCGNFLSPNTVKAIQTWSSCVTQHKNDGDIWKIFKMHFLAPKWGWCKHWVEAFDRAALLSRSDSWRFLLLQPICSSAKPTQLAEHCGEKQRGTRCRLSKIPTNRLPREPRSWSELPLAAIVARFFLFIQRTLTAPSWSGAFFKKAHPLHWTT